jgi:hypothetical protein
LGVHFLDFPFFSSRASLVSVLDDSLDACDGDASWAGVVSVEDDGPGAQEAPSEQKLTISEAHEARGRQVLARLQEAYVDPAPEEMLLYELVAGEQPLVEALRQAEISIAARLLAATTDPSLALAFAKALRELVTVKSALLRRTESVVSTAATLRAQRAFLARTSGASK